MPRVAPTLIVGIVLSMSGCTDDGGADEGRLIVQGRDDGQMDALIEGPITIEDGCTRLGDGERALGLVWPSGTKWSADTNSVLTAGGVEIADGVFIRVSGGGQSSDDLSYYQDDVLGPERLTDDRLECADEWWVLGSEIEVIDG